MITTPSRCCQSVYILIYLFPQLSLSPGGGKYPADHLYSSIICPLQQWRSRRSSSTPHFFSAGVSILPAAVFSVLVAHPHPHIAVPVRGYRASFPHSRLPPLIFFMSISISISQFTRIFVSPSLSPPGYFQPTLLSSLSISPVAVFSASVSLAVSTDGDRHSGYR